MVSLALSLTALIAAVDVTGSSTCPAPAEVATRIGKLAPEFAQQLTTVEATLDPIPDGVRILLRKPDGTLAGDRQLTGGARCGELADAAAVLVLSWARQLKAQAGDPTALQAPAFPEQDLPGAPPPVPEVVPEPPRAPLSFDVAAGLSASLAGGAPALGGAVFGALTSEESGVGGTLGLAALGARSSGSSTATWERFALTAGPHYRVRLAPVRIDLHGEFVAGLLSVVADSNGVSRAGFDPGVSGGVRVLGPASLWGGIHGTGWFRRQALTGGEMLPRFEVLLSAGLSWTSG